MLPESTKTVFDVITDFLASDPSPKTLLEFSHRYAVLWISLFFWEIAARIGTFVLSFGE